MKRLCAALACSLLLTACSTAPPAVEPEPPPRVGMPPVERAYSGTDLPFASEAVYFLLTDRFVDGDLANNYEQQGGTERGTFDRPIQLDGRRPANIGYLGGDFKGVADNAEYLADMGFTAVWLTPIVDNPDEAFTGGIRPGEGIFTDRGKTGYHGYWGVNFFVEDEHLVSPQMAFADLTRTLSAGHGMKLILDVVCNHGSPAYTMPEDQPLYGELYDRDGRLVADHQNLHPTELDPDNPLHAFYSREPDLAELSDLDPDNPAVLDYFVDAYTQWLNQGAAAFRIDTIKHMPHEYWRAFAARIREHSPDYFMFAEAFSYDAREIAEYTWPENGGIRVLDFPGQQAMGAVFAQDASYRELERVLHLDTGVYQNAYELLTFYDNHDMPRIAADEDGFVDAHNWLFTSRGIPVVYYGSEIGFRAGTDQHGGNRDYFGQHNIEAAKRHRIHGELRRIATLRRNSVALQRGLQANIAFDEDSAAFYRVYQDAELQQTALVLLNKGDTAREMAVTYGLSIGDWRDGFSGEMLKVRASDQSLELEVPAHGVRVLLLDAAVNNVELMRELDRLQSAAERPVRRAEEAPDDDAY
ncbi:MAG: alpha-amylase family glycosyl hydrolase [Pseudomonadota bacterium]